MIKLASPTLNLFLISKIFLYRYFSLDRLSVQTYTCSLTPGHLAQEGANILTGMDFGEFDQLVEVKTRLPYIFLHERRLDK
jgi:hypothetical protein